jgi:S-adenosylmethionine:tRNA ribosyltransferase-isomerase
MERDNLFTQNFSYPLPQDRIAKYPLADRNQSKLLVYKNGTIEEDLFYGLEKHLTKNSVLVFNDTKVLAARLYFQKSTGAKIEVFCLEPFESTVEETLGATRVCRWKCMVGNLKRWKEGEVLEKEIAGVQLKALIVKRKQQEVVVEFNWDGGISFAAILDEVGEIPLPPYLNRATEEKDGKTYQTVYAKQEGAVAAPTAGLHFVDNQLKELEQAGHQLSFLTLYVGAGTFKPVKSEKLTDHEMHQERIVIKKETLEQLSGMHGKIISVGTTSLRSLESLYWLALKRLEKKNQAINFVSQEDAYTLSPEISWKEACLSLVQQLNESGKVQLDFYSALFIMPSYQWQAISGLITNFHQPQSTLLALVSAWIGEDWKRVYDYALEHDFRFLSYGDSSLLIR